MDPFEKFIRSDDLQMICFQTQIWSSPLGSSCSFYLTNEDFTRSLRTIVEHDDVHVCVHLKRTFDWYLNQANY